MHWTFDVKLNRSVNQGAIKPRRIYRADTVSGTTDPWRYAFVSFNFPPCRCLTKQKKAQLGLKIALR